MKKYVVGVIGAGESAGLGDSKKAKTIGRLIAERGWVLLTGGRNAGVMKKANEGAKQVEGSCTVGILPSSECDASRDVDIVIQTEMGVARNAIIALSSDILVACGAGGAGTASEIALALKSGKTVVLLDPPPEFDAFFKKLGGAQILTASTPEQAAEFIEQFKNFK
jgi:uncharacterized protein (TIGR00725 family)